MRAPPTLLLSRVALRELATVNDYFEAARAAFEDMAEQRVQLASVGHMPAMDGAFHIKAASRTGAPAVALVKVNGNFPGNGARHDLPTIQGFIALLDAERGCVLAFMDSIEITARRTAAATALAAHYLAKRDARRLGVVGCGMQARYHIEALRDLLPIESVRYCDSNPNAERSFDDWLRQIGIRAQRAANAAAVCEGADIVVTLTTSTRPLIALAQVAPGTFVAGVGADNPGKHELAPDLLAASSVVVDSAAQTSTMGDLRHAIDGGVMTIADVRCELADLVVGRCAGRQHDQERWVFDSTGLAAQDLAAAVMILDRCRGADRLPTIDL